MIRDTGWYKSSYSSSGSEVCVEVRIIGSTIVGIRDSKDPAGRSLWVRPGDWVTFVAHATRD